MLSLLHLLGYIIPIAGAVFVKRRNGLGWLDFVVEEWVVHCYSCSWSLFLHCRLGCMEKWWRYEAPKIFINQQSHLQTIKAIKSCHFLQCINCLFKGITPYLRLYQSIVESSILSFCCLRPYTSYTMINIACDVE